MPTIIESKEFWQGQLERLKSSGLSRSQYCRENGTSYDRFGYWIKKLSLTSPTFVPVKLQAPEPLAVQPILCTIDLHGHILKIHDASVLTILFERLI